MVSHLNGLYSFSNAHLAVVQAADRFLSAPVSLLDQQPSPHHLHHQPAIVQGCCQAHHLNTSLIVSRQNDTGSNHSSKQLQSMCYLSSVFNQATIYCLHCLLHLVHYISEQLPAHQQAAFSQLICHPLFYLPSSQQPLFNIQGHLPAHQQANSHCSLLHRTSQSSHLSLSVL